MQTRRKRFSVLENKDELLDELFVPGGQVSMRSVSSNRSETCHNEVVNETDTGNCLIDTDETTRIAMSSCGYSTNQDDQTAADKLDMQLLVLEDDERSKVMHKLVTAFQQKVQACFDSFSADLTLSCLRIVTSVSALKPLSKTPHKNVRINPNGEGASREGSTLSPADPFSELDYNEAMTRELPNFTVSRLRTTIQQILRRATLRQDGSLYFPGASQTAMATKSVQYFIWYFEFMEYLQELHANFVERIFTPMYKYFHDFNLLGSNGRTTTMSSAFSKLSQFADGMSDEEQEDGGSMDEISQMKAQAKTSLKNLSHEYKDIKAIYDTSDIDNIAQRLSTVKEQIDFLLDEEDEVDPELYSIESGKMIQHLNIDFGTENLIRLVPDILVKLRKSVWLTHRWLELDDQRTKDVNKKLHKIATIEEKLSKRLDILKGDVSRDEKLLEDETNELSLLMEREGRSDKLNSKTCDINERIEKLEKDLKMLKKERDGFAPKLAEIVKSKNLREYHKLKFRFESNKLQRFVLERKLASLNYQRNLLKDDLHLELFVRPSVIYSSNKLQDDCERLEKVIREQKEEMSTIKNALIPIQEDKTSLINRVNRQLEDDALWHETPKDKHALPANGNALYLRSFHSNGPLNAPLPSLSSSQRGLTVQPRRFLIRSIPIGNNRAARTISPPMW